MQADKLREEELRAVRSAMANAEHDAGDVDDVPPRIEDDEDAYWAYCTYHGLRKLLAIAEASEGLRADAMFGRAIRGLLENARREEWGNRYFAARVIEAEAAALSGAVTQGESSV